jgi:hypothetical protein
MKMMKQNLKKCPFCGAEINQKEENELLEEVNQLKQKGILQQTIFVAVKIVQSMSEKNPVWFKEALDRQTEKINKSVERKLRDEGREVLKSIMELRGNPTAMGKIQEEAIAKRLSALKTGQDRFKTEKSRKSQEDVECIVVEDGLELGKIVIESKRTRNWREAYLEQLEKYMDRENTEFGILASIVMPDDSLNYTVWRNGILIVNIDYIEPAYIFLREHLKLKKTLEQKFSARMKNLEVKDQVLEELKKSITSGELDSIIQRLYETTLNIDNTISKAENYLARVFKTIKKDSSKIRECVERLVSEHIEKIRVQLLQQPLPPLLSD